MICMILAAGKGERLRPMTESVPKALVEVRGETLLERHLRAVRRAGIDTVVINLGWLGDKIVDRVGSGAAFGLDVVYSPEGENILETGGGIHRALPMLGESPFLVINADIYTDLTVPSVSLAPEDLGHLVMVPTPAYRDHGDFALNGSRIASQGDTLLTFSGVAIYRPEFFVDCDPGRFPLAPMLRRAADADLLSGELYEGFWRDVGTPARLSELNA